MTMRRTRPAGALVIVASALMSALMSAQAAAAAAATAPTHLELSEQVRRLEEKVARLEAERQRPAAESQALKAQADRTAADVLEDAERRSRIVPPPPLTAGHRDGRFFIRSDDGRFAVYPSVELQLRHVTSLRRENKADGSDDVQSGFELRRLRLSLGGNAFSEDVTYRFRWATGRNSGQLALDDGWVGYRIPGSPLAVRAGSFVNAWDRETAVATQRQLSSDRSVQHDVLQAGGINGENFVQGVELRYDAGGPVRGWVTYHDGFNSRNTGFADAGGGSPALGLTDVQWGAAGRAEYKLSGQWKDYRDFTARGASGDLLVLGVGADVDAGRGLTAHFHTADVQWKPAAVPGLSLFAAFVGVARDFRTPVDAGTDPSPYDWGAVAQAAYLLDQRGRWEAFGRYSYTSLDDRAPAGPGTLGAAARVTDAVEEFTIGVNHYFSGHDAKFTLDLLYLPNGSPFDLNGAGVLAQPTNDPEIVLRAQFQLLL